MRHVKSRRRALLAAGVLVCAAGLGGCGFRLRGAQQLAFSSLHIGTDANSPLGAALRRQVAASGTTRVEDDPAAADARLEIISYARGREILSLSGAGRVQELQLHQTLTFRVLDRSGQPLLDTATITVRREFGFDEERVIAMDQEEELLFQDIENDIVTQLMRRLAALKR